MERLRRDINRLNDTTAEMVKFSYYEQELIRRVIKSVISQIKSSVDASVAQDILNKTEWLE